MELRSPRGEEAERVLALLVARDTADLGEPDFTLQDLIQEWSASEYDMARDAVVCELDGEIAGYATVRTAGTFGAVAPDREGRGIGAALLAWTERRQRELGWKRHRTAAVAGNERAAQLMTQRGYELERSYWRMSITFGEAAVQSVPGRAPEGVSFRGLQPQADAQALYELDRAAFAAVAGTEPESLGAFREEHLQAHDLDPELSFVAERHGRVAGFLLTRRLRVESTGYVDILAVAPAEQGAGLGRTLLRQALQAIRASGLSRAELGVAADNAKALGLYDSAGMRPRFRIDVYARAVR